MKLQIIIGQPNQDLDQWSFFFNLKNDYGQKWMNQGALVIQELSTLVGEIQIPMRSENWTQVPKKTTTREVERGREKRERGASLGQDLTPSWWSTQSGGCLTIFTPIFSVAIGEAAICELLTTCVVTPFNIDNTYCLQWIFSYFIILT